MVSCRARDPVITGRSSSEHRAGISALDTARSFAETLYSKAPGKAAETIYRNPDENQCLDLL